MRPVVINTAGLIGAILAAWDAAQIQVALPEAMETRVFMEGWASAFETVIDTSSPAAPATSATFQYALAMTLIAFDALPVRCGNAVLDPESAAGAPIEEALRLAQRALHDALIAAPTAHASPGVH